VTPLEAYHLINPLVIMPVSLTDQHRFCDRTYHLINPLVIMPVSLTDQHRFCDRTQNQTLQPAQTHFWPRPERQEKIEQ
jgi:hypothetical protein